MEKIDIFLFDRKRKSVRFFLKDGSYSEEFTTKETALFFLIEFLIKEKYSTEERALKLSIFLEETDLPITGVGIFSESFYIYLFDEEINIKLESFVISKGLFLVESEDDIGYYFIGISDKRKSKVLAEKFYYKNDAQIFLNFLYDGGLINEEKRSTFIQYIQTTRLFDNDNGGEILNSVDGLKSFVPYSITQ